MTHPNTLAPKYAIFCGNRLAVDGLQVPETAHGHVLFDAGLGSRAVRGAHLLVPINMQPA
jgi:hypothetical protein